MAKKKAKKKAIKKVVKKATKKVTRKTTLSKMSSEKPKKKLTRPLAVIAFLLNVLIFVIPGIGSLIGGRTKAGIWQIALGVIGVLLSYALIGLPILLVAWIWGIITGIEILRESE